MANKSDDWIMWLVGGLLAFLGYSWITSQKAGGGAITDAEITPDSANVARTSGGCGCHR